MIVIPHDENRVKEYGLSLRSIRGMCGVLILCFAALLYFGIGYYIRLNQESEFAMLEAENRSLATQMKEVDHELLDLRQQMTELVSSDMRLRQMANLLPIDEDPGTNGTNGNHPTALLTGTKLMARKVSLDLENLLREADLVKGSFDEVATKLSKDIDIRDHTPSISPVLLSNAWISSPFGRRRHPFTGKMHTHRGLDISCRRGTHIFAAADGIVSRRKRDQELGKFIEIDHKYGLKSLYGHLKGFEVKYGQKVRRGQIIGYVGMTGRATAPHIHYGLKKNGRWVNPYPYILDRERPESNRALASKVK